jgi:hypothetical protein
MLALDYPFCGLIETDIQLARGWFAALMGLFDKGAADGLAVGAATVRAFEQRVLLKRPGYAVLMNIGAGMILLTREAARLILDHYRTPATPELRDWFLVSTGRDCAEFGEGAFRLGPGADVALASDYQYDMVLQRHGLCTLAADPGFAVDLAAGGVRAAELGGYATPAPPDPDGAAARAVAALAATLAACRATPQSAPYLHSAALGGWILFLHQLLFMVDSPARLVGRWRIVWSKHHGPFLFESDDPAAALILPLHGALCGLGYRGGADNAPIELHDGVRPAAVLEARSTEPRPLYARASLTAVGTAPVAIRAAGPGALRLFALGVTAPQPWLPTSPRLDAERLVRCFEMQAEQGYITLDGPLS